MKCAYLSSSHAHGAYRVLCRHLFRGMRRLSQTNEQSRKEICRRGTHAEHWSLHPSGTRAASISDWEAVCDETMVCGERCGEEIWAESMERETMMLYCTEACSLADAVDQARANKKARMRHERTASKDE